MQSKALPAGRPPEPDQRAGSARRLFVAYACLGLLPVLVLGVVFAASYRSAAGRRGIAEGRSEAVLFARTAIEPVLDGRPLAAGLSTAELDDLDRLDAHAIGPQDILRLRLRDLSGSVVFSDDGSGRGDRPEDEALDAARGAIVARLTALNSDSNDTGPAGPEAVEVYLPLMAGTPMRRVGVLEVYLPYAPIAADVTAELDDLYLGLAIGLALLYLALCGVTASVSRSLRRHARWNAYVAEHDLLTRLPNRRLFQGRVEDALRGRRGPPVTVAIVDLDRFKEVNDTLGHRSGDELLVEPARRLEAAIDAGDTVARLGGDEFGLVLTGVTDPAAALAALLAEIEHEAVVRDVPVSVEASIGYAVAPQDGTEVGELLQRADSAMYAAKLRHADVVRYEAGRDDHDPASFALLAELRHAIPAGQLVLHYQPKARLSDDGVPAVEALVRWQHPTLGLLQPGRFVPLAEPTDLVGDLTAWVVDAALRDLHHMPAGISVAVNVSARNLAEQAFAARVLDALERRAVAPERLVLEVTETALLADPPRAAAHLAALARRGVRVSIDDFGSGQTSLGYLSSLPVAELKIDRSFVGDMDVDRSHAAIVRAIVDLGHNLSLTVVGEGVETAGVLEALRAAGCDEAQGYFLARPMPLAALLVWLGRPSPALAAPHGSA